MTIKELIEQYIITAKKTMTGIEYISRNIITKKMGTIKFILTNKYFLNKRNIISCFAFIKRMFEYEFQKTNTKFRIEYEKKITICKILIVL